MNRRGFIFASTGLAGILVAKQAPIFIPSAVLMPVRPRTDYTDLEILIVGISYVINRDGTPCRRHMSREFAKYAVRYSEVIINKTTNEQMAIARQAYMSGLKVHTLNQQGEII